MLHLKMLYQTISQIIATYVIKRITWRLKSLYLKDCIEHSLVISSSVLLKDST